MQSRAHHVLFELCAHALHSTGAPLLVGVASVVVVDVST
jgi:hypothetical protein